MFAPAVILACVLEVVNLPHAAPLPVAYGDGGFSDDYMVGNTVLVRPGVANPQHGRNLRMVEPGHPSRDGGYPFVRAVVTLASVFCYISSIRASCLRNKLVFIVLGGVLSYGALIF